MAALALGALSKVSVQTGGATIAVPAATGGTGPYTYQMYQSTVSGFTPGAGTLISGATTGNGNQAVSSLAAGTTYYFKVIATDAAAASVTSAELAVVTSPAQAQNQFSQTVPVGLLDQKNNVNVTSAMIDVSEVSVLNQAGSAMKMVATSSGIPKVIACTANSDQVLGFIVYQAKDSTFQIGARCELALSGDVMYLISVGAIAAGAQVQLDLTYVGGVKTATGSSGARYVGWAMDAATGDGQLIRVKLATPSFTTF